MTADTHIHTRFSPDGAGDPEAFILRALDLGAEHVTFTEHVDLLYYDPSFVTDLDAYFARVRALQRKYADRIYVGAGLELGYTAQNRHLYADLTEKYRPDYIVNSVHQVGEYDCYAPEYFAGRTVKDAVCAYLDAVAESLLAPYPYDAVGHLGYVCRSAPRPASLYEVAPQKTDEIVRYLANSDKILELNTHVKTLCTPTLPDADALRQYVQAGGTRVCFASDAHSPDTLGRGYDAARALAQSCGLSRQTLVENGRRTQRPF